MAVTPEQTDTIFLGSGADSYSWYWDATVRTDDTGWTFTFRDGAEDEEHPEQGKAYTLTHKDVMRAARKIVAKGGQQTAKVSDECVRECRTLVFKDPEDCDFDADTADQVLQVAAFGAVVYG
jgi:hypothetical protein